MQRNNEKIWVGKISTMIILFLEIVCIIYRILGLNFSVLNSIVDLIADASFFMTVICFIFGVVAITSSSKSYGLLICCIIDIVIINRLYSNEKLTGIVAWMQNINKSLLFLGMIICFFAVFLMYKIIQKKRNEFKSKPDDNMYAEAPKTRMYSASDTNTFDSNAQLNVDYNETYEDEKTVKDVRHDKVVNDFAENENHSAYRNELRGINIFISSVCMGIIFLCIFDYIIFNITPLDITRPDIWEWVPNNFYYVAIISAAILVVLVIMNLFLSKFKPVATFMKNKFNSNSTFRWSAITAIVVEFAAIMLNEQLKSVNITNMFLSAVTDNWFSSIFALVVSFFILQIACTIFFHLFEGSSEGNQIISMLKEHITYIEEKMVLIACNIVGGCVDLFDFIPDFFATIGVVLLDKEKNMEKSDEKGQKNYKQEMDEKKE